MQTRLLPRMADPTLSVGQRLMGKIGGYKVLKQFEEGRDVWKAE